MPDPSPTSVAIIGAGIAGLACAQRLQQAGLAVTIFEKSRGPSGRLSTRRTPDWACDHGAPYFEVDDAEFRSQVDMWQQQGLLATWHVREMVFNAGGALIGEAMRDKWVGTPAMTSPAYDMARHLDLRSETTISSLRRSSEHWSLRSLEHGDLDAVYDHVIIAIPPPQAAALLNDHAPSFKAIAESVVMAPCWVLMLTFEHPTALPFEACTLTDDPLARAFNHRSKPGRQGIETWTLHASSEWSREHLEDAPEDIAKTLLATFARLGGPAPSTWTGHRWRYAQATSPLRVGCLWDATAHIGLCGDWLYGSGVQGAWLSGTLLADRLITERKENSR